MNVQRNPIWEIMLYECEFGLMSYKPLPKKSKIGFVFDVGFRV